MNNTHANGMNGSIHKTSLMKPEANRTANKHERLLNLAKKAIELELQAKEVMEELENEVHATGLHDLPAVLLALVGRNPTVPTVGRTSNSKPVKVVPPKNMGGALKGRIMGLMSDKKERKSKEIIDTLGMSKQPTSVYTVLATLIKEGHLVKPRFAHYRLKLRGS